MPTATLTSKGQVTIPAEVRTRLGLKTGDKVDFVYGEHGEVILRSGRTPFEEIIGVLARGTGPSKAADLRDQIRSAVQSRWRRKTSPSG